MSMYRFTNDYSEAAHPDVLAALIKNPATDAAIADQNRDFGILMGERRTWLDLINDK